MLSRLPYRLQIPLGLSMAVVLTALLVTAVTARHSAQAARAQIMSTADSTANLIAAQAPPLLATDDVWGGYALMKATAALLPGAERQLSRSAILDSSGRVLAASDPGTLKTATMLLSDQSYRQPLPLAEELNTRLQSFADDGSLVMVEPLKSDDGQVLGFSYIEIDAPSFAINWLELAYPALIGVGLAVALLLPVGWWMGQRMTRPIARIANIIARIGTDSTDRLEDEIPDTHDPELGRIGSAVNQLIKETQLRKKVEQRAYSAERLAAIGRMTAVVAHEINNPLGGLLNVVKTLSAHGHREDTRASSLALLDRGLHQIQSTVTALLPQAKLEKRPLDVIDLDDIILLARTSAGSQSMEIRATTEIESALRVPADPVRQVMLNLLSNALKVVDDRGVLEATLQADENEVRFLVSNSGTSMSEKVLDRIITAESGKDPRGFGLWVCREIAIRYDGGFRVIENEHNLTQLLFWIPNVERYETTPAD